MDSDRPGNSQGAYNEASGTQHGGPPQGAEAYPPPPPPPPLTQQDYYPQQFYINPAQLPAQANVAPRRSNNDLNFGLVGLLVVGTIVALWLFVFNKSNSPSTSESASPGVTFDKVAAEQGDILDGKMYVTATLTLRNLGDMPVNVTARFYDKSGALWKDASGKVVEAKQAVQPTRSDAAHKEVVLSVPMGDRGLSLPDEGGNVTYLINVSTEDGTVNTDSPKQTLKIEWPYGRGG